MSSDFDFGPFDPDDVVAAEAPPSMSSDTTLLDSAVTSSSVDVLSGELDFNLDLDDEDPSPLLTGGGVVTAIVKTMTLTRRKAAVKVLVFRAVCCWLTLLC